MARPSLVRTNISRLRLALGLNQNDFAKLVGRSIAAVQSLEIGRLRLSTQLAGELAARTGVSPRWLLESQLDEAPYDLVGRPWSIANFQRLQHEVPHHLKQDDEVYRQRMLELGTQLGVARNLAGLRRIYRSLNNAGEALEFGRKVDQFIASEMGKMDIKPDVNMMEETRYAEHEAERKSQNVMRVLGVKPPTVADATSFTQPELGVDRVERPKGSALVGAAWRKAQ